MVFRRLAASLQQAISRCHASGAAAPSAWTAVAVASQAPAPAAASALSPTSLMCLRTLVSFSTASGSDMLHMASASRSHLQVWSADSKLCSSSSSGSSCSSSLVPVRLYAAPALVPRFRGGKLKPYSAYKRRFKLTGTGKVRYMAPGYVHKRFNKTKRALQDLSKTQSVHEAYAKVMRRLGFVSRSF